MTSRHQKTTAGMIKNYFMTVDNTAMDILYYNTYIWNQLSIVVHNINCSEEKVLIYDGPSSKSKLLGELQGHYPITDIFISSLSIVSIYFIGHADFLYSYNMLVSSIRHQNTPNLLNISATETMPIQVNYEATTENIFSTISTSSFSR